MGPVNWVAMGLAALVGTFLRAVWPGGGQARWRDHAGTLVVMLLAASLIGHNFARVGAGVLAVKPWLYAMMSGGFAVALVGPAVALTLVRLGGGWRGALIDAAGWLAAYLAMGAVFWALA